MAKSLFKPIKIKYPRIKPIRLIPPKRERVPAKKLKQLKEKAKGKCMRCRIPFKGFTPHVHHLNMKAMDNRISNLKLVCPTCHAKYHSEKSKVTIGRTLLGERKYKVITRDQKKRRVKAGYGYLGQPTYKYKKKKTTKSRIKKRKKERKKSGAWGLEPVKFKF